MITFCLTSCNRPELLKKTLESFFRFNTASIDRYIIQDDSGVKGCLDEAVKDYPFIEVYYNPVRLGMLKNIDALYSHLTDKHGFIFHCEDDWEFTRSGFIEQSATILKNRPGVLIVWIRDPCDTNGHTIELDIQKHGDIIYRYVSTGYAGCWHGYTTNPGLRRVKDVVNFGDIIGDHAGVGEELISEYYFKKGFRSVILHPGYVKHIGWGLSCGHPEKQLQ